MPKKLHKSKLSEIAKIVKESIFIPRKDRKVTVFLCGADVSDTNTARSKMAAILSNNHRFELLYPEDLFDDLLAGQGQHSLLRLENTLAKSVDAIVLFPESPGSFAELGAFSNKDELAKKMVVLANKKYKREKSFINYGPNRLVRSSGTGKVLHINYDDLSDTLLSQGIYRKVSDAISKIRREHPVARDVTNILEVENFILPCIYIIDEVDNLSLYKLVEYATEQDPKMCEIATKASLGRLSARSFITRNTKGYQVTKDGAAFVRETFSSASLDKARVELLNGLFRRNATVLYTRN